MQLVPNLYVIVQITLTLWDSNIVWDCKLIAEDFGAFFMYTLWYNTRFNFKLMSPQPTLLKFQLLVIPTWCDIKHDLTCQREVKVGRM